VGLCSPKTDLRCVDAPRQNVSTPNSRRNARTNHVKPGHAREWIAIGFSLLHITVAVAGTDDEHVVPGQSGRPFCFPK
jgi:hypothetical protein